MVPNVNPLDQANTNVPTLIEHAVRHLAPFVLSASGIQGLQDFRLVCRLWNQVGTELLEKNYCLHLYQESSQTLDQVYDEGNPPPPRETGKSVHSIQNFIEFERWRAEQDTDIRGLRFPNLHLHQIPTGIIDFLDSEGPWSLHVTKLHLSDFTVLEYNYLLENIVQSLPNLTSLRLDIEKEVDLSSHEEVYPGTQRLAPSVESKSLKEFHLFVSSDMRDPEQVKTFQWNVLQQCPNLESLHITMEPCFATGENPLPKIINDLKTLQPRPKLSTIDLDGVTGLELEIASMINYFSPVKVKIPLYDRGIRPFFQQLNANSCMTMTELDLHLIVWSLRDSLTDLLLNALPSENFKNLRVLKIKCGKCRSDSIINTAVKVPKLESVRELHFSAIISYEREVIAFYQKVPYIFPNLETFRAKPKTPKEVKCILSQLSMLTNLQKIFLSENAFRSECLDNTVLFGDAGGKDSYKGLLAFPRLREFGIAIDPKRNLFDEASFDIGFAKIPSLTRLRMTAPASPKVAQSFVDKFHQLGIVLEFIKSRW